MESQCSIGQVARHYGETRKPLSTGHWPRSTQGQAGRCVVQTHERPHALVPTSDVYQMDHVHTASASLGREEIYLSRFRGNITGVEPFFTMHPTQPSSAMSPPRSRPTRQPRASAPRHVDFRTAGFSHGARHRQHGKNRLESNFSQPIFTAPSATNVVALMAHTVQQGHSSASQPCETMRAACMAQRAASKTTL